jgi:hypothetical protein
MAAPKAAALPLGYTPMKHSQLLTSNFNGAGGFDNENKEQAAVRKANRHRKKKPNSKELGLKYTKKWNRCQSDFPLIWAPGERALR